MTALAPAPGWRRRLLLALAASTVAFAGAARAHEAGAAGDAPAVTLSAVVAAASLAGVGGGLVAVAANASLRAGALAAFDALVGVVLVVLGATYAASVAGAAPVLAAGGVAVGLVAARLAARGGDRATRDHAAAAAVVSHRAVEGVALAAVYIAGSAVGLAGAALIAAHATVETVAVGAMYAPGRPPPRRGRRPRGTGRLPRRRRGRLRARGRGADGVPGRRGRRRRGRAARGRRGRTRPRPARVVAARRVGLRRARAACTGRVLAGIGRPATECGVRDVRRKRRIGRFQRFSVWIAWPSAFSQASITPSASVG
ncbi:hypothetical protein [Halostella litorea]|uniref:hypothetical protein n=1 Tax=Halostella litorea TaxID=2528831 RepID=UPI001387251F|nr:hypothetical protein [Halostella litorea]